MKNIVSKISENKLNEDKNALKNLDNDLYYLICKLLGQFVNGNVDIPEKNNKELIKDAKVLLFNLG